MAAASPYGKAISIFRKVSLLLAVAGLAACGDSSIARITDTLSMVAPSFKESAIDPSKVERIPYASILAKVGGADWAILVLGKVDAEKLYWFSADKSVIVTEHGRIVQTVGFPRDLRSLKLFARDYLSQPLEDQPTSVVLRRQIDTATGDLYGVGLESEVNVVGRETVTVNGKPRLTVHVRESTTIPALNERYEDDFWRDALTGEVVRSRQHWVPGYRPITIELGRPRGG